METGNWSVEVVAATLKQEPILANLLELYIHDFSEFHGVEIGEDGRFGYPSLPLYCSDPDRYPFFIRAEGKLAGLVFVHQIVDTAANTRVWDIAEFFVLRSYRRHGVGTQVAHAIWRHFPGSWQVRVMQSNTPAQHFWADAIASFTGRAIHPSHFTHNGEDWLQFSFESGTATQPMQD